MEIGKFTGGHFHMLYKPSSIGRVGDNIRFDYDLTVPPAFTEELIDTIEDICKRISILFELAGISAWVTKGYRGSE